MYINHNPLRIAKHLEDTTTANAKKDLERLKYDEFWKNVTKLVNYILLLLMVLVVKPTLQTTGVIIFTPY